MDIKKAKKIEELQNKIIPLIAEIEKFQSYDRPEIEPFQVAGFWFAPDTSLPSYEAMKQDILNRMNRVLESFRRQRFEL